jgi:hypothetical protein
MKDGVAARYGFKNTIVPVTGKKQRKNSSMKKERPVWAKKNSCQVWQLFFMNK